MNILRADIERYALERIASVFSLTTDMIDKNWRFGHELKASFRSDFCQNELDCINDDIHDVADRETLLAFKKGALTISSVGDYCDLMVRRAASDERKVLQVLKP